MRYLTIIILLLIISPAVAQTPIDYTKWQTGETTFRSTVGGPLFNYPDTDTTFATIENDFVAEGDSVVVADKAVLKTRVNKRGITTITLSYEGDEYVLTQELKGVGWINVNTRQRQWIDNSMDWSNFSLNGNRAEWSGVSPGIDYSVIKENSRVSHRIFFKPGFLDSAVTLYNQRADSADIALANLMVYSLSNNIDDADSEIGDVSKRVLKQFARRTFQLSEQQVSYLGPQGPIPEDSTQPVVMVRQAWRRINGKMYCIEYVMMSDLKRIHEAFPTQTIWHNTTTEVSGTSVEDCLIFGGDPNIEFGTVANYELWKSDERFLFRAINLTAELGARTSSVCSLSVYVTAKDGNGNFDVYGMWKIAWVEGPTNGGTAPCGAANEGATANCWDAAASFEWGTVLCEATNDAGSINDTDNGGDDRTATSLGRRLVNSTNQYYEWTLGTWDDDTGNLDTLSVIMMDAGGDAWMNHTEAASNRPFFTFNYTATGGGEAVPHIMRTIIID